MLLTIHQAQRKKVHPRQMMSYRAFRDRFHSEGETEPRFLEKFYATRLLVEEGYTDIFVDAVLIPHSQDDISSGVAVDVCGELDGKLAAVFCEAERPTAELYEKLGLMSLASNTEAIIICPKIMDVNDLTARFVEHFNTGKFSIESITWLSGDVVSTFKEVMELVALLGNYTRMRMLLPLLTHSQKKRHYRTQINPKLIYENLTALMEHRLVDELSDDEYSLTPIGHEILSEYLTFLQNVKKVIEKMDEEVK